MVNLGDHLRKDGLTVSNKQVEDLLVLLHIVACPLSENVLVTIKQALINQIHSKLILNVLKDSTCVCLLRVLLLKQPLDVALTQQKCILY